MEARNVSLGEVRFQGAADVLGTLTHVDSTVVASNLLQRVSNHHRDEGFSLLLSKDLDVVEVHAEVAQDPISSRL